MGTVSALGGFGKSWTVPALPPTCSVTPASYFSCLENGTLPPGSAPQCWAPWCLPALVSRLHSDP